MKRLGMSRLKNCINIFEGLILVVLLVFNCGSANAITLPFEDDFENIAVGDYPDENGWEVLFSGKSSYVSDVVAHNGTKSFRLDSNPSWARMDYVYLEEVPDRLKCEVSICLDPSQGKAAIAGFMKGVGSQGPSWNRFSVSTVHGRAFFESADLGTYTPGTWCTLRADLDFTSLEAAVWRDGQLIAEGVPIAPKEFDHPTYGHVVMNRWGVASHNYSGGSANVVYFDDVRIEALPPTIEAAIDIDPDTLNLNSKGKWITCYIELPENYDVEDIDVSTIKLNNQVPAESHPTGIGDEDDDGVPDLMVKFDREAVQKILQAGDEVDITVTGELKDETSFEGSDTIRVIDKGGKK